MGTHSKCLSEALLMSIMSTHNIRFWQEIWQLLQGYQPLYVAMAETTVCSIPLESTLFTSYPNILNTSTGNKTMARNQNVWKFRVNIGPCLIRNQCLLLFTTYFYLEFYGPVNSVKVMLSQSVSLLALFSSRLGPLKSLFVLRFYGPVNPMRSCRARSVYLTTRLLGRLSPLSG